MDWIASINAANRLKAAQEIAENGLSESTEYWIRQVVRNPGRAWWRGGPFAFRHLGKLRYQVRCGVYGNGHFDGVIEADSKSDAYAKITETIEKNILQAVRA